MTFAPALSFQAPSASTALIAVGALLSYFASRAAADALAGGDPRKPGLRALGHCLPVAAVALLCLHPWVTRPDAVGGRPQIAVGLVFATSVACLSLVLGIVTYLSPLAAEIPPSRRAWPFVLPAAMLALVAGFSGSLSLTHAGVLALLGIVVLNLWVDPATAESTAATYPLAAAEPAEGAPKRDYRWLQLTLAIALSLVGGWAMARGAAKMELSSRTFTGPLVAAAVLSPLLTLPVLGTTTRLAERGSPGSAVATLVAMALVNLCLVLPLVVVAHHLVTGLFDAAPASATTAPTALDNAYAVSSAFGRPVPYPLMSWRIDTVLLVVLGFGLIPWSLGRWAISRGESAALIFGYAIYLALTAFMSRDWR